MTINRHLKELRGKSRRRFLKFTAAAGAVFAADRAEVLNVIADNAGHAMADDAACTTQTNRHVALNAGNGGFAWFQLVFPHTDVAQSNNANYAWHAQGQAVEAQDTDKPFWHAPESPWQDMNSSKRISAFVCGNNETHTAQPSSAAQMGNGVGMLAGAASLQSQLSSLLPVIGVNPFNFGNAPGAPAVTNVGNPQGMVDLFNSSASQALLSIPKDAQLYEAYYKAFLGLNRSASRPTWSRQMRITKASANFLGKNLAALLMPSDNDMARYGAGGGAPNNIRDLAYGIIVATKAFKLGLTNMVILPAMRDDPHGAFNNMGQLQNNVTSLGMMLNELYADLGDTPDPACTGKSLADTTVLTIHGDTPKNPLNRNGWPDGTPQNSNWVYVMGNGYLKTGWFGGVRDDGSVAGWDPATGDDIEGMGGGGLAADAGAAVAYAIAQGDLTRVSSVAAVTPGAGVIVPQLV